MYAVGVQAVGQLGYTDNNADANILLTSVTGVGQVGDTTEFVGIEVSTVGVQGVGVVGNVNPAANADVYVTGVQGNTILANVLVWGQIDDDQNPGWTNVFYYKYTDGGMMFGGAPYASTAFSGIAGNETNDPAVTWTNVNDEETTDWQLVAA